MEVYEKIRYLHEQEGLSQRGIASHLGISRNTVKKYFDGSHVPWQRQGISGRYPTVGTIVSNNVRKNHRYSHWGKQPHRVFAGSL